MDPASPPLPPLRNEFDRWVNEKVIDDKDLSTWRKRIHKAVAARIDWDLDAEFATFKDLFKAQYFHFEGQFTTADRGDVRLVISTTPQNGLAVRDVVTSFAPTEILCGRAFPDP